jgi:hypothetical protein
MMDVGVQGGEINGKQDIGGKGVVEGVEDGEKMVRISDVRR